MKKIKTKRNLDADFARSAKGRIHEDVDKIEEMKAMETSDVKKPSGNIGIFTLLVVCLTFASMVYLFTQMSDRIDKLETRLESAAGNLTVGLAAGAEYVGSQTPFCYGYDQNGQKGFAVDGRKIKTPCEGVNASR